MVGLFYHCIYDLDSRAPSIDTPLHGLLPFKHIDHLHPDALIGIAAATVTATSLGIVVDDTVHLLTKFLRGRREKGYSTADSIRYSLNTVGKAVTINTVILVAGFGILMMSSFKMNQELGALTATAITAALILDFLLLPALLLVLDKKSSNKNITQGNTYVPST